MDPINVIQRQRLHPLQNSWDRKWLEHKSWYWFFYVDNPSAGLFSAPVFRPQGDDGYLSLMVIMVTNNSRLLVLECFTPPGRFSWSKPHLCKQPLHLVLYSEKTLSVSRSTKWHLWAPGISTFVNPSSIKKKNYYYYSYFFSLWQHWYKDEYNLAGL